MRRNGFTLIELMLVVTLASILAGILTANFLLVSKKSRDSKREADADALAKSLLIYVTDKGSMPSCGLAEDCAGDFAPGSCLSVAMAPYISPLPTDPVGGYFCYDVCTNGSTCNNTFGNLYYVQTHMESTGNLQYLLLNP